ncbi:GyrI-like domain-containing protein [Anaerocolumna sp. MB42-C2]|uniref:GyrI-like domain-containing protein n=1 Tax=Anaerocolumna sp. MB42-C2 TaxID=3070997 RepID=UPI0027E10291|nr:GyrI-like domain-containing protein [Anaerocolumna sp. MB42-C2]WMJ88557.1 GyrI-like domain-containing protein [Anaerocolumna sp. MB42-C2]
MQNIRIINIPQLKVVSSGAITNMEEFEAFDKWWSAIDVSHYITPRDFMWYNEKEEYMEWVFAVPDNYDNFDKYKLVDFPGGLYAVATSRDTDEDSNITKEQICKWVIESGCFELSTEENDTTIRYTMAHVLTPKIFKDKMGYHLSDNFVPIIAI